MRRPVGLLMLAAVLLAACGPGGGQTPSPGTSPKYGGTLRVAQESELRTLDPVESSQLVERGVFYNMYESLVAIDEQLTIVPALATKWDTSDPKNYVFTLRSGVKFHDGTDFNADAVKFNIDRILNAARSPRKGELVNVQSVEVKDPQTVIFHLKNIDAALLPQLVDRAGMILSPKAIQQGGQDFSRNPVGAGTGPFVFVEWKKDDHLTLKKNPNYWRPGLPYLDQVIFRAMTNDDGRTAALRTGDIDVARLIAYKDVPVVQKDSNLIYREVPGLAWAGIRPNRASGPLADTAKAKAVALALDKAQIQKNVFFNVGAVAYGPIPSSIPWAYDPSQRIYDKPDIDKAKATATGFSFTLKASNNPDTIQEAQLIKDQLAKAGITVTIQVQEFGQLLNELDQRNFDAAILGWSGRIDPDGNMYIHFHTGQPNNYGRYSNKQVDKSLEDARLTLDQARRKQLYQDAQKILVEEAAQIFIRHDPAQQITTNKVHNFRLIPDAMFRFVEVWKD